MGSDVMLWHEHVLSCCIVTVAISSLEEARKLVGGMESLFYKEMLMIVQCEEEKAPGRPFFWLFST